MRPPPIRCFASLAVISLGWLIGCQPLPPSRTGESSTGSLVSTGEEEDAPPPIARYASQEEADRYSAGCFSCHSSTDSNSMHQSPNARISCTDCHGGDPSVHRPDDVSPERPFDDKLLALMKKAHVPPRFPDAWSDPSTSRYSSANPVRSYALLNYEDPAFIQFVNPGDLRVADRACGQCHAEIVYRVRRSMMTHGAQLWGAALYNNGSYPHKHARFGESYGRLGAPQRLKAVPSPAPEERRRGVLDFLDPLPRWEITQMGNILRAFERGGKVQRRELEPGLPNVLEEPGKPDMKLGDRGLGTQLSTDPVFLGLQKTRLLDPLLSFLGTNDHPGDFRSSGCSACHVVYANDRFPVHSGPFAAFGNLGRTTTSDPMIAPEESGHPIRHEMTRGIPSSQCIVCHVHPGTSFANTYLGYTWWDNETHGEYMYPARQRYPTAEQYVQSLMSNPEGSAARGLWSSAAPRRKEWDHKGREAADGFLENLTDLNDHLDKTQFADFHGHGWVFRAVFKQDRKGRMLDSSNRVVDVVTPEKLKQAVAFESKDWSDTPRPHTPVHLKDIHAERGMHCVDCHFEQDSHGDGKLYGEVRNAVEIGCIDCHGTITEAATLRSSGPAAPEKGNKLANAMTMNGSRFVSGMQDGVPYVKQRSSVVKGLEWEVPQLVNSVNVKLSGRTSVRGRPYYNPKAAYAKTLQKGAKKPWGDSTCQEEQLAHSNRNMACYTCHTAWMTSCFGCHLPMRANFRVPMLHNEGELLRNFTSYNFQVLRDDVFMLGKDSTVKRFGKDPSREECGIVPVRSSSAVIVGSANANREWVYSQQQTISSEGYSGQAFNPHFPHAVRKTETRTCTDCHVSRENDNNAWMAQVLLQGTNFVNFLGRHVYVAEGKEGFEAVVVTEREEPQAVIGSDLHQLAYPDEFERHKDHDRRLKVAYEHRMVDGLFPVRGEILDLQMRGEYLYTARGAGGFYAYDIANVDNKGFSERLITAPVSPLGQSFHVKTKYATAVASPSTLAVDPTRLRLSNDATKPPATLLDPRETHHVNQEEQTHPVYAFLYVTDKHEGLVVIGDRKTGVATLLDGNPTNNFLKRAAVYNPDGTLDGAVNLTIAGHRAYVCCDRGLAVVNLNDPLNPGPTIVIPSAQIVSPRAVAVQFRYAFVTDREGLKVVDITHPDRPRFIAEAFVPIEEANRLYVARTYAYIAAGKDGLVIVDIERPEAPRIDQVFTADGTINDARDVKVGMTNAGVFAYVADGENGLRVIQLTSPDDTPGYGGFSPRPRPRLIATYPTHGPALAISKGLDRDRAVDESGHQIAVFGRIGARPLNLEEQQRLYLREGEVYSVEDSVPTDSASGE